MITESQMYDIINDLVNAENLEQLEETHQIGEQIWKDLFEEIKKEISLTVDINP